MTFLLAAFGLLAHVLFWGAGLAWLVTPRPWRRFWPVFAGVCGLTLQSAVVWVGVHAELPGTRSYAWPAELLPLILLVAAGWRHGRRGVRSLSRFTGLAVAMAAALAAVVWPWAMASGELTSMSLGSCDAADYAAGARVFQEFAPGDRGGFLGLSEVVRVGSVDNFFDYWLRLNHFTPSALMALNGTIFGLSPHQIASVFTAVCLVLTMPLTFWLARATFRYGPAVSLGLALLYGVNPVTWYAVYHVATGQLLAANGIALLTWAGFAAWRRGATGWRGVSLGGLLTVGSALIWGGYTFIILVATAPVVTYVAMRALRHGGWNRLGRWCVVAGAAMVVSGAFFWERVAGLGERLELFRRADFGWRIPLLSPEGWFGALATPELEGHSPWVRWLLSALILGVLAGAVAAGLRRRDRRVLLLAALSVPILVGYGWLHVRGALRGTNASYDAYKLFSVFYPGLLAALAFGTTLWRRRAGAGVRWMVGVVAVLVLALDVHGARAMSLRMRRLPLVVDRALASVASLERRPEIDSLNILLPDSWSQLWANAFLLRKPHYFPVQSYEGRRGTALEGRFDLIGGIIAVHLPGAGEAVVEPNPPELQAPYAVVDTRSRHFVRATFGAGWHEGERLSHPPAVWRWSRGDAALRVENPHPHPLWVHLLVDGRSLVERDLQLWANGRQLGAERIGEQRQAVVVAPFELSSGVTELELRSSTLPTSPGGGERRSLGFAVFRIVLEVQR